MKSRTYVDNFYYLFVNLYYVLSIVLCGIILFFHVNTLYVVVSSLILLFESIFIFNFYKLNYEFLDNKIVINVGPFQKKIFYNDIKKCYITSNSRLSYATSLKRIAIVTKDETIYISPIKMDRALKKIIDKKRGL